MIRYSKETIKELIKNGFDKELISFELGISIEELEKLKAEMQKQKTKPISRSYDKEIKNNQAHTKMEQMRHRYRQLFFNSNQEKTIEIRELSQEELDKINMVISNIQNIVKEIKEKTKLERGRSALTILKEIKSIRDYQLTIEQEEELNRLLQVEELQNLSVNYIDRIDFYLDRMRKLMVRKLVDAVNIAQSKTNDIEELRALGTKITSKIQMENQLLVGAVKGRIDNKITKLQTQNALERIRNDVSINILQIIDSLSNGKLDVQNANEIINEEARKRVEGKPKNRFTLSEEQEKTQILIQIRTVLSEQVDKFNIISPKTTILQLHELCGGGLEQSIRAVVENLIRRKDFETAKTICDDFASKDKQSQIAKYMRDLKMRIRNAEISDIVLKAINTNATVEEETKCFELIEKGIKMGNVNLRAVSLGKSEDGLRNITLADIWTDENQRQKTK